ncbi:chorismate-binding protein [bacterium]|jgi:isochorismate synthase|nr:chorismate-binding protein [bacterium]MBT4291219.1 chorismate-binding protein [bacterium]
MFKSTDIGSDMNLQSLWIESVNDGNAVAIWRAPHSEQIHFIADKSPSKGRIDLQQPGFAVSPFLNPEGNETLFLKADKHSVFDKVEQFDGLVPYHLNSRPDTEISGEKSHFIKMVEDGVAAINDGEFDKVVPARTLDQPLAADFNVLNQFYKMADAYPAAFVSLLSIPGIGTWTGATPELLIESSAEHFRTFSLAGTQPFVEGSDLSEAAWNQKEIEEQAMVSRYIIEQFKTIRLRKFVESGPRTVQAGNMIHLKTEYTVDLNVVNMPELGSVMLQLLHPTSAVCGMPKFPSLSFIIENESLNRELYSGFLGPVNMDGTTQLYVNLRCMQILRNRAVLYAGAGVTHGSKTEKEWDETALKCQTLLDVM